MVAIVGQASERPMAELIKDAMDEDDLECSCGLGGVPFPKHTPSCEMYKGDINA
jgi:hypothetical protein